MTEQRGLGGLLFFLLCGVGIECDALSARSNSKFVAKVLFSESGNSIATSKNGHRKLKPGSLLFIGEQIYSRDGHLKIRLREGNNDIFIGAHTQIRIDQASSSGRLNGTKVFLSKGAARFVVNAQYSGLGSDRFQVKTSTSIVDALGTVFIVSYDPNTQISTTATLDGTTLTRSNSSPGVKFVTVGLTNSISKNLGASTAEPILKSDLARSLVSQLAEGRLYGVGQIRTAELDDRRAQTLRTRLESNQSKEERELSKTESQKLKGSDSAGRTPKTNGSDALEKLLVRALGI